MESIRKERKKRTDFSRDAGYVYAILQSPEKGRARVKIGASRYHPSQRLVSLQYTSLDPLEVLHSVPVPSPFKTEYTLHIIYQNLQISGYDWFLYDAESMEIFPCLASWVSNHRPDALRGNFPALLASQVTKSYRASLVRQSVRQRLKRLRLEHDLTPMDMARAMGVDCNVIHVMESRVIKKIPHEGLLDKATQVLGVSMNYLLLGEE